MTTHRPAFTVGIDQKPYIPVGTRTVDAIIRVRARAGAAASRPLAAEVIVLDASSSMTGVKMDKAREAAARAVEALREGTLFAVVAGRSTAEAVYPPRGLVAAGPDTRRDAARAIADAAASGGTRMSSWLKLAARLLEGTPAEIRHVTLLTDGQNMEGSEPLAAALAACAGRFVCDCRGIGDDWSYAELRRISTALLGSWDLVAAPEHLVADFQAMMAATMAKRVAGVTLRVNLPSTGGEVLEFGRVMPSITDLRSLAVVHGPRTVDFPIGDWGEQAADYQLCVRVGESAPYKEAANSRAAVIEVLVPKADGTGLEVVAGGHPDGIITAYWTRDERLSDLPDPVVTGYSDRVQIYRAVDAAVSAWDSGDADAAEKFGLAVRLAHEQNRDDDLMDQLARFVFIDDAEHGRVRLRPRENTGNRLPNDVSRTVERSAPIGRGVDGDRKGDRNGGRDGDRNGGRDGDRNGGRDGVGGGRQDG